MLILIMIVILIIVLIIPTVLIIILILILVVLTRSVPAASRSGRARPAGRLPLVFIYYT